MIAAATGRERVRARAEREAVGLATMSVFFAAAAMGLAYPVVSLNLEALTGSGLIVAGGAAMAALSTLAAAPFAPGVFARLGMRRATLIGGTGAAVIFAAIAVADTVWAWFALRLAFGAAITMVFVASEVWVNQRVRPHTRSRCLGIHAAFLAAGFGVGGALIRVTGVEGWPPALAGAGLCALSTAPYLLSRQRLVRPRPDDAHPLAVWRAAFIAPIAITAAVTFGMIETTALTFLPVYAVRLGWGEAGAANLIVAIALGTMLLQAPLGWLADTTGRVRVLILCASVGAVAPLLLAFAPPNQAVTLAVTFVFGGVVVGMYGVGLAVIAARAPQRAMAQVNAAFVFAYGLGALISPVAAGAAIDWADPHGVLFALSAFALTFLVFAGGQRAFMR